MKTINFIELFSIRFLVAGLTIALFSGCFFARPPVTEFYTLDYIPTPDKKRKEKGPYPFSVKIQEFNIAEAYRRKQIVYRQSAHQMQFYDYHRWAVDPERMITDLVVKHLKEAKLFESVVRRVGSYVPELNFTGDVLAIEEYDSKEQWYAHLALEFRLEDGNTNEVLWQKTYDLRKRVAQHDPVYVVRELSYLLELINTKVVDALEVKLDELKYKTTISEKDTVGTP